MNHDGYPDAYIRGILNTVKTIAMVGISPKENRPSYFAFKYLLERGYHMVPVNPSQAGKEILGQKVYANLTEVPEPIDMVDVFRASPFVMPVVEEAIKLTPKPQVLWMQLSVRNDEAAALAEANGMKVVMTAARRSNTAGCRRRFPGWASIRAPSPRSGRRITAAAFSVWGWASTTSVRPKPCRF